MYVNIKTCRHTYKRIFIVYDVKTIIEQLVNNPNCRSIFKGEQITPLNNDDILQQSHRHTRANTNILEKRDSNQ